MTALSLNPPLLAWLGPDDRIDPQARGVRPPGPAEQAARVRARPTPLWQALLLAALLHLWAALLLGNVPPGTAPPGQGVGGALNIRLQGGSGPAREPQAEPAPPLPQTGPPGDAARERHGGTVRRQQAPAAAEPGAARLGDWARQAAAPALPPLQAVETVRPLSGAALLPLPVAEPIALGAAAPQPLAQVAPLAPSAIGALPAPALLPAALPALAPLQALAERELASSASALTQATPAALLPLAEGLAAEQGVARALDPPTLPTLPPLAEAPAAQLAAQGRLDQPVQPLAAAAEPVLPATAPAAAQPADLASALPGLPALAALDATAPPGTTASRGAPDAGARVGADIATAPSAPASAPALNLNLPRPRGGELSRLGGAGLLPVLPRLPERKTRLEEEIEAAGRADCRTAHANKGLLAVVPLAVDTVRGQGGCKW